MKKIKTPVAACTAIILLAGSLLYALNYRKTNAPPVTYTGQINALFSVDANGNGNYAIPVEVPPGTAQMQPTLAISYNTIQENDIMGVGWELLGLSQITRVPATLAQDGYFGYLAYDTADRYALDGQRLILVQGSYTADSAVFHTQVESWAKVIGYNQCGSGFCSFRVYMKNGLIKDYATGVKAAGLASMRTWMLSKVTDRNGNYMTIDYTVDSLNSACYPKTITYTLNEGITQYRYVQFGYEPRADSIPTYQGGSVIRYNKRLNSIQSYIGNQLAMSYSIAYQQGVSTGKSQVTTITQCGGDGGCLNPTTVYWQGQDSSFYNQPVSSVQSIPNTGLNLPMDVNGDGLIDYVHAWQGSTNQLMMAMYISNGSGFNAPVVTNTGLGAYTNYMPLRPMDVNGDGMIDLVYVVQSSGNQLQYTVLLSNGSGFVLQKTVTTNIAAYSLPNNIVSMDINGDGKSDMVFPSQSSKNLLQYQVMISNGQTFNILPQVTTNLPAYTNFPNLVSARINNDPQEDLVYGYSTGQPALIVVPLLSTGQGFNTGQPPLKTSQAVDMYTHLMPSDMNGDGLSDLVISWMQGSNIQTGIFYSNGLNYAETYNSYTQPSFPVQQATIIPMEINGDGKVDLMYNYADQNGNMQLTPYLSNGWTFKQQPSLPSPNIAWTQFGTVPVDVNGDAKSDLVTLASSSSGPNNSQFAYMLATQPFPDLVNTISSGLGGQVAINYSPLTNASVYSKQPVQGSLLGGNNVINRISGATYPAGNAGQGVYGSAGASFPVITETVPMYVVSSYTQYDGIGNAYPYSFRYAGAKVDLSGYGWLGFASKVMTDVSNNSLDSTNYQQLFPFTGKIQNSSLFRLSDGALLTRTRAAFAKTNPVAGLNTLCQVLQTQTRTDQYTYGTFNYTIGNNYTYDSYGNVTLLAELNDTSMKGKTGYTIQKFTYDTASWQLGLMTEKKIATDSLGKNYLEWSRQTYSPNQEVITDSRWMQGNEWVTQTFTHDTYGNRTNVIFNGTDTTTIVYDPVYFTFTQQIIQPPNAQGRRLAYNYTYHPIFGQLTSKTDPNGNTTATVYNSVGDIIATLGPDPNGKMDTLSTSVNVAVSTGGYYTLTTTRLDWKDDSTHWVRNYKDGIDRVYRVMSQGPSAGTTRITDRVLDSRNRIIRESMPYFQGANAASIAWSYQQYDPYGRLIRLSSPVGNGDSSVTQISYPDGYTVSTLNAAGTADSSRITQVYNYVNSTKTLVASTDATGGLTSYQRDILGRVISSTDPMGLQTSMQYNGLAQRTQMIDKTLGRTTYQYSNAGYTMRQVYNNGSYVVSRFDKLWRVLSRTSSDGDSLAYVYDEPATVNGLGHLTSVYMKNGAAYRYSYDAYSNTAGIALSFGGQNYISSQTYTPNHFPDQLTYPDGSVLQYEYTPDGMIESMSLDDATDGKKGNFRQYVNYQGYNAMGNPSAANFGNNVTEKYNWYSNGLISNHLLTDANGKQVVSDSFYWDHASRIEAINSAIGQLDQSFSYDAAGRLTGAVSANGPNTYKYDANGNIKQKNGQQFFYSNYFARFALNGNDTAFSASYDSVGNMISKTEGDTTYNYAYTTRFGLSSVAVNGRQVYGFLYDYNGNRLQKTDIVNKVTTLYVTPDYTVNISGGSSTHTKYIIGPSGMAASVTSTGAMAANHIRAQATKGSALMKKAQAGLLGTIIQFTDDWTSGLNASSMAWGTLLLVNIAFLLFFLYRYYRNHFHGRKGRQLMQLNFWRGLPKAQWAIPLMFAAYTFAISGCSTRANPIFNPQAAKGLPAPGIIYYHQDFVNSTTVATNASGQVQTQLQYLPFGEVYKVNGTDNVTYKFSNKELDNGSDLYYFNARYYDADMCRFITADSQLGGELHHPDIFNRYAYALNSPVNFTDPSGHGIFSWFASLLIDLVEIAAGVAIEALSGGSMTLLAETLIGAGINGAIYSATHYNNFSWKDWGVQEAVGAVMGLAFAGLGMLGEAAGNAIKGGSEAAEMTAGESGESASGRVCMREVGSNEKMVFEEQEMDGASITNAQCFAAGTRVSTEHGQKNIEDIQEGDRVWSYDEQTGQSMLQEVVTLFRNVSDEKITITAGGAVIVTTPEHPFWQKGKGWTLAKSISRGAKLLSLDGSEISVTSVRIEKGSFPVYNFEVENTHTYYVSGEEVLVHNVCKSPQGLDYDVEIEISSARWPESAQHITDAQNGGHPDVLTIARSGAKDNRYEWQSTGNYPTKSGFDRDEYPPAMFKEGGGSASIRYMSPSDNRGCGSFFGNFLRWTNNGGAYPDGTRVWFHVVP
jgi:RHS repeat-associated protein